ncbi:MAG: tryptophan--tRNA ligase [Lactobacillaceae bacterium]|jgi:tryptophanyl-tRNA synthetase|nr:tryptophan--tRNA ligase [Lactobacillaceae bacterium]
MLEGKVVLTGVKPTGTPHLGNYLGAIKPVINLGNKAPSHYMFIADYHAINAEKDPGVLNQKLKEIACVYLAFGMNPEHTIFYRQSDIPEIPEITTILYAYTPKGLMNKSHAYKAFVDKNREAGKPDDDGINMGLYTYPTLMAADILTFNSDIVPVGKDQVQHVEIARDIAGAINAHYGKELLKLPKFHIEERVAIVPGTDGRKMSKSYGNVIPLFEDDKAIKKAVFSVQTDSRPIEEPKDPESVMIYQIYKAIATPAQLQEMAAGLKDGKLGYGHIKNMLLDAVIAEIGEAREKYNYYMNNFHLVEEMLAKGAERARPVAKETLKRLKNAVFGR